MTSDCTKQLAVISTIHYVFVVINIICIIALFIYSAWTSCSSLASFGFIIGTIWVCITYIFDYRVAENIDRYEGLFYCRVISTIKCLSFPFGTAIGVWTLMVLFDEEVEKQFNSRIMTAFDEYGRPVKLK